MEENYYNVEYKEVDRITGALPGSLSKEVVAFANTEGGDLYIGISDDGSIVGVSAPDKLMVRISNTLRDTILPDIMSFVQIRSISMDSKTVIHVTVNAGTERPYYLKKFGLKPTGVFRRVGSSCQPLSEAGIREMIMETYGKSYEDGRSLEQNLSFITLKKEMSERNLEFSNTQMKTLRLIGEDGLYTNLALLLSDECPYTTKVAIFQGTDNTVFRDRFEFTGSLLKQLTDVYAMLDRYNATAASFNGLKREDFRDYPKEALREALLNSIIHRDYTFSGSTIINLFDDHIEFVSLGGLVRGLSLEAIFMGASQSRNPKLAAIFYRLDLVESYGTGIRKIIRLYHDYPLKPDFRTAEGVFTVTLYNRNYTIDLPLKTENTESSTQYINKDLKTNILDLVNMKGNVSRKQVEDALDISTTTAYTYLKKLCDDGVITQRKRGKNTVYVKAN